MNVSDQVKNDVAVASVDDLNHEEALIISPDVLSEYP